MRKQEHELISNSIQAAKLGDILVFSSIETSLNYVQPNDRLNTQATKKDT
jgi:hypothetical protein